MKISTKLPLLLLGLCCFQTQAKLTHPDIIDEVSCFSGENKDVETWVKKLEKGKNKTYTEEQKKIYNTFFNGAKLAVECVDFVYKVDDNLVHGYYVKPKTNTPKKLPVIIYNRGGNAFFGHVFFGRKIGFLADYAKAGYIVIGSNYRGGRVSSSFAEKRYFNENNGQDEFGGADIKDVTKLIDIVKQMPEADSDRIAMMGWSRGGAQTYSALQQTDQIKTAVIIAGPTDYLKGLEWRSEMENVYRKRIPNYETNKVEELTKRSVIKNLDKMPADVPLLLVHGDQDVRVSIKHAELLVAELSKLNRPHKYVVYENDGHGLRKHRKELLQETLSWFETYL